MLIVSEEAMRIPWKLAGYSPSDEQLAVHRALSLPGGTPAVPQPRLVMVGGGIQAGKSYFVGHHVLSRFMTDEITWLVGRRYSDAKREYAYTRDTAVRIGLAKAADCSYSADGPWEMRFINGHVVKTLSSDDTTRLASEAPDGIVLCEPGRQTFDAYETSWERVVPKSGWLGVVGTFEKSAGWYRSLFRECEGENEYSGVSLRLPSYSNRHYYPQGEQDPKFQAEMQRARNDPVGWDRFQERFLGIPRIPHDMVFYEFSRRVHVSAAAEFIPGIDVYLAIDPGFNPSPAVVLFIQVVSGQVRVFDEIYVHKVLRRDVITQVTQHYAFRHITDAVLDPYGGSQANMGADPAVEEWRARFDQHGIDVRLLGSRPRISERIERVHDYLHQNPMLNQPGVIFHPRVKNTILEMEGWIDDDGNERGYRYHVGSDGVIHSQNPIPQDDHSASALGYFILDRFGSHDVRQLARPAARQSVPAYMTQGRRGQFASAGRKGR